MKVGIPQALLYYYYFPFWDTIFKELGIDIYISKMTNKEILDNGCKYAVADICAPIKIFTGHVIDCLNNADYVFIPRFASIVKPEYFCPKFMGLPDIISGTIPNANNKIISPTLDGGNGISNPRAYQVLTEKFGFSLRELTTALRKAEYIFSKFENLLLKGYTIDKALDTYSSNNLDNKVTLLEINEDITIGVMGYVYNIYDKFISMDVIKKLENMNVNIKTFEMVSFEESYKYLKKYRKKLFWTFSNRVLGASLYYLSNKMVDGIIHVTAFGCGPDAIVGRFLQYECDVHNIPFTTLRVDEHTGEGHLITRIEAFADMLKRKKWAKSWR